MVASDIESRFGSDGIEVVANYTGGTKTMSLGLGNFALHPARAWALQTNVVGKGRDNLVKITAGDTATLQDTTSIDVQAVLDLARTLVTRHDFEGAAALLQGYLAGTKLPKETKPRGVQGDLAVSAPRRVRSPGFRRGRALWRDPGRGERSQEGQGAELRVPGDHSEHSLEGQESHGPGTGGRGARVGTTSRGHRPLR